VSEADNLPLQPAIVQSQFLPSEEVRKQAWELEEDTLQSSSTAGDGSRTVSAVGRGWGIKMKTVVGRISVSAVGRAAGGGQSSMTTGDGPITVSATGGGDVGGGQSSITVFASGSGVGGGQSCTTTPPAASAGAVIMSNWSRRNIVARGVNFRRIDAQIMSVR
jgi:hypothetical protein